MGARTAVADKDMKLDIIDHINQDHTDELMVMAQFYSPDRKVDAASILDFYNEGVLCEVVSGQARQELFIEFELEGDLEENLLYLSFQAAVKQKKSLSLNQKSFFEVLDKQPLTPNFTRLVVRGQGPLPAYYPEYAYGFQLKLLKKAGAASASRPAQKGVLGSLLDRGLLWIIKRVSSQRRQRIIETLNKDIRLYTLRQSCKATPASAFLDQGLVDIFTHDDSPGSQWVQSLGTGDIIAAATQIAYKHDYLMQGQTVLITDETGYPSVAALLEHWANPQPPTVIVISAAACEQDYFPEQAFAPGTVVHRIVCAASEQAEQVIQVLQSLAAIEAVWGALENEAAKTVRRYLRNERALAGKYSHLKGYWKHK